MPTQVFPPSSVRISARHWEDVPQGTDPRTHPSSVEINVTDDTDRSSAAAAAGTVRAAGGLGVGVTVDAAGEVVAVWVAMEVGVRLEPTLAGLEEHPLSTQAALTAANPATVHRGAARGTTCRLLRLGLGLTMKPCPRVPSSGGH
jgi:hypothetical protein